MIRRFIPTPVGNTGRNGEKPFGKPVHPHTRGEHQPQLVGLAAEGGSSPHPWGTLWPDLRFHGEHRFIPTPVGNTASRWQTSNPGTVHPHTRGEHMYSEANRSRMSGSSPHPWGTRRASELNPRYFRFIPTPVGNTVFHSEVGFFNAVHPHTRGEHCNLVPVHT